MYEEKKILIADDDDDFRGIVATKLKNLGFQVTEARNGREAVAAAEEDAPDLIVLDVSMPEMDGMEAFFNMQRDPNLKKIKKAFLTNYGDPYKEASWIDEKFAREAGALDYIKKTDDLNEIADQIKKLLRKPPAD